MNSFIEMNIHQLELNLLLSNPTVVLKDVNSDRKLALFIDKDHVDILNKSINGDALPFCCSIQTTLEIIPAIGGRFLAVEISRQDENGCYSDLVIRNYKNEEIRLSSPTGFALVMAQYSGIPILVSEQLFKNSKVAEVTETDLDMMLEKMNRELISLLNGQKNLKYKM